MELTAVATRLRSAVSWQPDARKAAEEILEGLGDVDAAAVMFFASPAIGGEAIGQALTRHFPSATVIGCTTAGEFTERATGTGGVSAIALPRSLVRTAAAALADLDGGVDAGVTAAVAQLERQLDRPLRDLDPSRYVGFVLIDGLHGDEERVNDLLGNAAPLLSFVGGSAGDDLAFTRTTVYAEGAGHDHGAALLVLESDAPFQVVKSCSFEPMGRTFTITDADVPQRIVWELDGRPAAQVYAEAVGCGAADLGSTVFMSHPVGLMIDGRPWIRSPQQVVEGRGLKFYCQVLPQMQVELMRGTDLIAETRNDLRQAAGDLGGQVSGAVMFNCILRRLEIDQKNLGDKFVDALADIPTAGFHTYGESWLGHINQTLTAVLFGAPRSAAR
jgi:hypothetical protein